MNVLQRIVLLGSLILAGCNGSPSADAAHTADTVLLGGSITTLDDAHPKASALAIKAGRIVYVGDSDGAERWVGQHTHTLHLDQQSVLPGLIDTHIHVMESALTLDDCSFDDAALTVEQTAQPIRECAARAPGSGWVMVQNLNAAGFRATRRELDKIIADRPLFLWSADGHVGWGNSAALKVSGIDRHTRDPADGRIERDAKGEPTGFLVDGALSLIESHEPEPTPQKRLATLRKILPQLQATGLTAFMEANTSAATVGSYVQLAREGGLTAKVNFALQSDGPVSDAEFARLKKLRELAQTQPLLRGDTIKLFADGVMEYPTQSAAMLAPYLDGKGHVTGNSGRLNYSLQALTEFVERAARENFNIHVHAIGDGAVRETLDAFAAARAAGSTRTYSIAHLQLIDPADLPRFKALNVYASLQLLWAQPDNYTFESLLPYLGPERQGRIYPARSLLNAGATIVGGSDWSVSSYNPFEAMATAISRSNPKEPQRGVLDVREALKFHEILRAYSLGAARMLGRDQDIGSLKVGKAADLIVLDRQLDDSTPADRLRTTKVTYAFSDGRLVVGAFPP